MTLMRSTEKQVLIADDLRTAVIQIIETCRTDYQVRDVLAVLQALKNAQAVQQNEGDHANTVETHQPE